ncbi:muscarinic acetylcholine receptor DM1 [Cimex lectularius]|uniref:G-protein coupled receptors family 1 profile domain-containing protein n=1 Tax=Cimex lectularius TaxID=79782 RepID=A0A8I6SLQ7_CIMLE|nr:muscarinic acetylcholine receptor DM1 [Cimex lectularius]XP_024085493.1 muscarinic acetylcholine receptor DM1 [Cimex lectularius]
MVPEALNVSINESLVNVTEAQPKDHYTITQIVFIAIVAIFLSIVTVVGNIMVMISFKIDKQLQTISNYFLFSLAVADFAIGLISMPLFTVSTIMGYWPLGPHVCDTWLALDYLASNASVLNLLIISFDRYFSVTRPLTYRAKRTTNRAAFMITSAWGLSLILWPPWIYSWPYIEGKRTVPDTECYIQFIETNHYITFGTAIAAFYVPVTVMCFLYYRIWRETKKRQKDLPNLQAGKKDSSKRSNSSDEAVDLEDWKKSRGDGGAKTVSGGSDQTRIEYGMPGDPNQYHKKPRPFTWRWIREWCIAWWHSGREDIEGECELEDTPSDMGYATPVSVETPLQSSVSRCTSMNVIRDPYAGGGVPQTPRLAHHLHYDSRSLPPTTRLQGRSLSTDSVYTILIRLPGDNSCDGVTEQQQPSIKMITDDLASTPVRAGMRGRVENSTTDYNLSLHPGGGYHAAVNRRPSHISDIRIPLTAKIIPKQLAAGQRHPPPKKKRKTQEKKADKKAAKTLSAILLTFIITWTPYNILVLLKPITECTDCIPQGVWDFFYYLCYINSTINPVCYALCNASFRRTYVRILTCKWHNRNRTAMNRGFYN